MWRRWRAGDSISVISRALGKPPGVTKARGHFPGDDAVVKLLWLAIINIEDKRARERVVHKEKTGKINNSPSTARLIEGQRTIGWREALIELDIAYPGRK
ncbi:hypothetical protein AB0F17_65470 [Nonomuraea sp. NPDC026600]|uniref:hypothetical protein n=1 Tax=Nonomuraea sp. NPDC026600 TaxID=3155363 RepID=UPI00340E6ACF